jgi:cobalt-zinc-cadmium efflux system protein
MAALVVIVIFMVVEVVGGIISGSLALLADATHMLTDAVALGLAVSAHFIASRPADEKRHFGYRRAQVLAAYSNGVLLFGLLLLLGFEAIKRLINPVDVAWQPMLGVAFLGLGANAAAYIILHTARTRDVNVRGAMLHIVSDLLGSVAAIAAAFVIAGTGWMPIDPLLSIVVAVLIGHSAYRLVRETGHILLEGAPDNIDVAKLAKGVMAAAPGVEDVHDVFIWQLTPEHTRLTLHARVDEAGKSEATLNLIKSYLEREYGIQESTVQIEVGSNCPDCGEAANSKVVTRPERARRDRHHHHHHASEHGGHGAVLAGHHK